MSELVDFSDLLGKTIKEVTGEMGGDAIVFITEQYRYKMYHEQDCCESVYIEDIIGDLSSLIGSPVVMAEEVISGEHPEGFKEEYEPESFTWTFYKLATNSGYVTIRWYGTSNGYYSESVSIYREEL